MDFTTPTSRRRFLQAAGAVAVPLIVPASVFGQAAPSNRLNLAAIGVGQMGGGNLQAFLHTSGVQVVAVCDVDAERAARARQTVERHYGERLGKDYSGCFQTTDLREIMARGDIDAVCISTADHWHVPAALMAVRAGKDVFCEKPLSLTIHEGRVLSDAVRQYGRVFLLGSQQRSESRFRFACELVRNGVIGKVHTVEVGLPNGPSTGPRQPLPVPEHLDWNLWLGPAPWRPFTNFGRIGPHWDWRWIMDYSCGQLTDWAGHHIDIAHWGLDLDHTGPTEVEGVGSFPSEGIFDAPTSYRFTCKYETGVEIIVANQSQHPHGMGARWIGEHGWVHVNRGGLNASNPAWLQRDILGSNAIRLYRSNNHIGNFIDCVKTRRETIVPAETGCRSISVAHLGEIAMLTGRKIRWNPVTEEIQGDPQASALLSRAYREPWRL